LKYLFLLIPVFSFLFIAPGWEERTDWPDEYPRPPKTTKSLFFIQRNLNANTITYDVQLKTDGSINTNSPIDAYWLRYGEDGARKDLSWLQSIWAYGYTSRWLKKEQSYRVKLKAYNERYLSLKQDNGAWKAFMDINGEPCYLHNIYVYADESGVFPDVKYVDIYGVNVVTKKPVKERIFNK